MYFQEAFRTMGCFTRFTVQYHIHCRFHPIWNQFKPKARLSIALCYLSEWVRQNCQDTQMPSQWLYTHLQQLPRWARGKPMDPYICVSDPAGLPTTEAAVHHTVFVTSVLWPCRVSVCTTAQPIPHPGRKDPILGMSSMKDPASQIWYVKKGRKTVS